MEALNIEDEMAIGSYCLGDLVRARGLGPRGDKEWFTARVVGIRSTWPPLAVKYIANAEGETNPLVLPQPLKAFLWAVDVEALS